MTIGDGPLRILCSYNYFHGVDMDAMAARFRHPPQIFADSGAYSAFTQGAEISVKDYAAWCKRWSHLLGTVANLDDLHDPVTTWRNQKALEAEGLYPVPVFHMGSHFDWLRRYLDEGYRYIALGKMVGRELAPMMRWAIRCFKIAKPYGAVFHGFGLTRAESIAALPFYSVDSSSWGSGHRYGRVSVWNADLERFDAFDCWDRKGVYRLARYIRESGYDPEVFLDRSRYHRSYPAGMSAVAWLNFEQYVRDRHGPVPLPEEARPYVKPAQAGLNLFLVDGSVTPDGNARNLISADDGLQLHLVSSHWTKVVVGSIEAPLERLRAEDGLNIHLACTGGDPRDLAIAQAGTTYEESKEGQP